MRPTLMERERLEEERQRCREIVAALDEIIGALLEDDALYRRLNEVVRGPSHWVVAGAASRVRRWAAGIEFALKVPLDTPGLNLICLVAPEPVTDPTTKQQQADANGEPLYLVELVAFTDEGAQVFTITFPGSPAPALRQGVPVKVTGLVASEYDVNERYGLRFRAAKVEAEAHKGGAA